MINFHHLRVFYHVAKNLSYTLAARDLYISQPAVTKQVKALEDTWNLKLFNKRGAKIYLTEEGKALSEYAAKVFSYEKEIELAAEELKTLKRGIIRLGTPRPFRFLMSFLMDTFHKEYPSIRIQVIEGSSLSLMHNLLDNEVDIILVSKVEDHPHVRFVHFCHEEVSFIVSPDHFLAQRSELSLKDLSKISIILKGVGSGTRKVALDLFDRHGVTPNVLLETNNSDFIKELLLRGEAGAFLAEAEIASLVQEGKLVRVPIEDHKLALEIYVAYLKDQLPSLPARTFLSLLSRIEDTSKHFPYLVASWPKNLSFVDDL